MTVPGVRATTLSARVLLAVAFFRVWRVGHQYPQASHPRRSLRESVPFESVPFFGHGPAKSFVEESGDQFTPQKGSPGSILLCCGGGKSWRGVVGELQVESLQIRMPHMPTIDMHVI